MNILLAFALVLVATLPAAAQKPAQDYLVWVASEATDRVALVRFGPGGARIDRELTVGYMPTDPDGPHGVAVSPDGRYLYVTTAHGTPNGKLWKYDLHNDSLTATVELGSFPATLQVTPDGHFAYVVNFNLHGEMVPSSVSIVAVGDMLEVARLTTCVMPHGSRITADGTRQYSACMMNDMVVEIDTRDLGVARHFVVTKGKEQVMRGAPAAGEHHGHDMSGHGMSNPAPGDAGCSPTWAQPSADGTRVYVACNKSNDIPEIDVATGRVTRRLPARNGVYNLAVSQDGTRLVATNKRDQSVSVFELPSGRELARIPTTRPVVHGAVVSPDGRYAFVSVEGIGSEPGTVEIIDMRSLRIAGSVDVGQMAGGIDFWKTEPARQP
jgi:DNA-binding beta-propeller fold protein YncE